MGIIFEYTVLGTPQQNGVVERAFVTVMGCARAMMNHVGFTMVKRQELWSEAAQTATLLDNVLVQDSAKTPLLLSFLEWMQNVPSIKKFLEKCVMWQMQIINLGGPRLIQEERSVDLYTVEMLSGLVNMGRILQD